MIFLRLGIYGGTFNPPHIGHVRAAAEAVRALGLDVLLVVPSGMPPHKTLPAGTPAAEDRLELCRLSFAEMSYTEIIDRELREAGVSYTVDTVDAILSRYPGAEVYLIMGTDMYLTLESWKDAERLLDAVTPAVLAKKRRGGGEHRSLRRPYPQKIRHKDRNSSKRDYRDFLD